MHKMENAGRPPIAKTWRTFEAKVRNRNFALLKTLGTYPNAILVSGCQRSGTTMLASLISQSPSVIQPSGEETGELTSANVLCGARELENDNRYCFQTTYLNDGYIELLMHSNYQLVWLIRNPQSVVYSMLYNWKRAALNRLFKRCGLELVDRSIKSRYAMFGPTVLSRIYKGCLSYNAKVAQLHHLHSKLDNKQFCVIDYDQIVSEPLTLLPKLFGFLNLELHQKMVPFVHSDSRKKSNNLNPAQRKLINSLCSEEYSSTQGLLSFE